MPDEWSTQGSDMKLGPSEWDDGRESAFERQGPEVFREAGLVSTTLDDVARTAARHHYRHDPRSPAESLP